MFLRREVGGGVFQPLEDLEPAFTGEGFENGFEID
jgi:hypothetical protein